MSQRLIFPPFWGAEVAKIGASCQHVGLGRARVLVPTFLAHETNHQPLGQLWKEQPRFGRGWSQWQRKQHRWNGIIPNPPAWPWEALGRVPRRWASGREQRCGTVSLGDGLGAYLAGDSAVVCTALPETPAVACDASDQLVLIGEVHLPDQGPVTKNPHFSASTSTATVEAERVWIAACRTRYPLRLAQALMAAIPALVAQSILGLEVRGEFSGSFSVNVIILFPCLG